MRRLLITGPTGFIGAHCLARLLASDFEEIDAVNRGGTGPGGDRVRWHAADLRDPVAAAALIHQVRPTHVLHGAWIATPGVYWQARENLDWLAASLALIRAFGETAGQRFVGVGSSAEYDPTEEPCREDATRLRPASIYGQCKLACSIGLGAAARSYGFSSAWARVFLPYGPGDPPQRLVPSVLASLRAHRPIALSAGTQIRDFIYAPDAADLLARLVHSPATGAFNVCSGEGVSIRTALETLADVVGVRDCLQFGAIAMRPGEPQVLVGCTDKVRETLGWHAPTSLDEGLAIVCRTEQVSAPSKVSG